MYIGIDIGGTNVRVASTETLENPQIKYKIAFTNLSTFEENIRQIFEAIHKLTPSPKYIGISMPGRLNVEKTIITHSRTVKQWVNQPIKEKFLKEFDCPIEMNGDQYCSALSEAIVSNNKTDFYYIGYGTGIGAARVTYIDSKPNVVRFSDEEHAKYLLPWQLACGGKWTEKEFNKPAANFSNSEWGVIMERFSPHLLKFIKELQPSRIVFAGGMAVKQWPRLQNVFNELKDKQSEFSEFDIRLAHYGENAGIYGALYLLKSEFHVQSHYEY